MIIVIICCPVCEVINFKINLSFLAKPSSCMMKTSGQKFKYLILKNMKSVKHEIKSIFHHFKGLSLKQIKTTLWQDESSTIITKFAQFYFCIFCKFSLFYVLSRIILSKNVNEKMYSNIIQSTLQLDSQIDWYTFSSKFYLTIFNTFFRFAMTQT